MASGCHSAATWHKPLASHILWAGKPFSPTGRPSSPALPRLRPLQTTDGAYGLLLGVSVICHEIAHQWCANPAPAAADWPTCSVLKHASACAPGARAPAGDAVALATQQA